MNGFKDHSRAFYGVSVRYVITDRSVSATVRIDDKGLRMECQMVIPIDLLG